VKTDDGDGHEFHQYLYRLAAGDSSFAFLAAAAELLGWAGPFATLLEQGENGRKAEGPANEPGSSGFGY
jgi:hypothetical protein